MEEKVFIVLATSEVCYDNLETEVVAIKRTRESAEKVIADRKAFINKIWKNKNLEIDEDVAGCFSCHNDNGYDYQVWLEERKIED